MSARRLVAALAALTLAACVPTPAAAATRSTHCGATAAWRLIGSDETATVRVRAWRVTSKAEPGTIAVCARAWSLSGDQWVAIRVSTDYLQRGWMVKGSGSKLTRIPDSASFITVEASNNEWASSARTEWER